MLMISHTVSYTFLCVSMSLFLLGCAPIPNAGNLILEETSSSPEDTSSQLKQPLFTDPAVVDGSSDDPIPRLPLGNYDYMQSELENYKTIGAQFLTDHQDAYALAESIYSYRDFHNALIFQESFTDITTVDPALLVEIAVSQSPHIDLYSQAFLSAGEEHPVKQFFLRQQDNKTPVGLLSYGSDVRRVAKALFGEHYNLPAENGKRILYNTTLDLYYLTGETSSLVTDYPVVVSVTETADGGRVAEVIRLCYWDYYGMWSTPNNSWESGEHAAINTVKAYVSQNLDRLAHYRYTLAPYLDGWRVTGFAKV